MEQPSNWNILSIIENLQDRIEFLEDANEYLKNRYNEQITLNETADEMFKGIISEIEFLKNKKTAT